jgi:aspartyl protease family protein
VVIILLAVGCAALALRDPKAATPASASAPASGWHPVEAPVAAAPRALPPSTPPALVGGETVLTRSAAGRFDATAQVNGAPVHFLVDTGADVVALTEADARAAGVFVDPSQYRVVGRGAGGPVRGQPVTLASLELDGKRAVDVDAVVLEGAGQSLLGQSYLRRLGSVAINGDTMTLR